MTTRRKQQLRRNARRYYQKHKKQQQLAICKANTRSFILNYASLNEVHRIEKII